LFKYIEFNPNSQMDDYMRLHQLFYEVGIDPDYYLVVDSSSDLPYDLYGSGEEEERLPIHLLMPNHELKELSRQSDIVESISGKERADDKLYVPEDFLYEKTTTDAMAEIKEILNA